MPAPVPIDERVHDQLLAAKRAASKEFLVAAPPGPELVAFAASSEPRHNVVGVGIGRKIVKGKPTSKLCLRFYVERKFAKAAIPKELLLPASWQGSDTDVVETGRFYPQSAAVSLAQRRLRPARPGCSVGFQFSGAMARFVMAGTFGAVVQSNGKWFILSNNHVLANENKLAVGSPIFQPGLLDGGDPVRDQIATLSRFVPISAGQPNTVDCAIAEVVDRRNVRTRFLPKVGQLRSPDPAPVSEGMKVHKIGRTTWYTTGVVFDTSADITIRYDVGRVTFQDQVLIRGGSGLFSDQGDSGAVIVEMASGRPAALLFAGSRGVNPYTIANHLPEVLSKLQVTIVR